MGLEKNLFLCLSERLLGVPQLTLNLKILDLDLMNEIVDGTRTTLGIAGIFLPSYFSMLGGRGEAFGIKGRIWKRWIAPITLGIYICIFALVVGRFHWLYLLSIPGFVIESYMDGWGNNSNSEFLKVLSRLASSLIFCMSTVLFPIISYRWWWWITQSILCVVITVITQFQTQEKAASEEFIIHFLRRCLTPLLV